MSGTACKDTKQRGYLPTVMECQYQLTDDSRNGGRKLPAMSNRSSPYNLHLSNPRHHRADPSAASLSDVSVLSIPRTPLINYEPILNLPKHKSGDVANLSKRCPRYNRSFTRQCLGADDLVFLGGNGQKMDVVVL